VVEVTSNNIAAISWRYVLLGVRHQSTQREPPVLTPEYPERTTVIDTGVPKENHRHSERHWLTITYSCIDYTSPLEKIELVTAGSFFYM